MAGCHCAVGSMQCPIIGARDVHECCVSAEICEEGSYAVHKLLKLCVLFVVLQCLALATASLAPAPSEE
jgi:hypothetical protein